MAEELLINVNVQGEEQIPGLDKKLDNVNKTAGKTKDAFAQMRAEMKQAKADMLSAAEGSDKYNEAMKRAAASADKMRDMNDKIKASQRDVGVVAKNVTGMVSGMAGAFSTAQGIIGLFGVESDNVTKAILRVTQVMQVTSGIAQFADSFDSMKDIFLAVKLRIAEMVAVKTTDTAVTNVNTAAQVANAAAVKGVGVAATTSAKAVAKALGPYALVAAAIGAIIYGISKLIDKINEVPEEVKLRIEIDKDITPKLTDTYSKAMKFAYDYNQAVKSGNKERIEDLRKVGTEELGLHSKQLDMIADNVDNWKKAFDNYLEYAEQTYKMEALIKMSTESEVADILAKARIKKAEDERKSLIKNLKEQGAPESYINKMGSGTFAGTFLPQFGSDAGLSRGKMPSVFKETDEAFILLFSKNRDEIYKNLDRLSQVSRELVKANEAGIVAGKALENNEIINKEINNLKTDTEKTLQKLNTLFGTGKKNKTTPEKSTVELTKQPVRPDLQEASPAVERALIDQKVLGQIDREVEVDKIGHNKRMELINERAKMGNLEYIKSLIKEQEEIRNANEKIVENETKKLDGLYALYNDAIGIHNFRVSEINKSYDTELAKLNEYNTQKADIQNRLNTATDQFNKATTDKERNRIKGVIDNIEAEKIANEDNIDNTKKNLTKLDDAKKKMATDGEGIIKGYEESIKNTADAIVEANGRIADSTEELANLTREKWLEMGRNAQQFLGVLGGMTDTLAQYYQAEQKQIDTQTEGYKKVANGSKLTKKEEEKLRKNDVKTYNAAQKAKNGSDKDRAAFVKQIEEDAWEIKAKLFEKEKAAQKAGVLMNTASGIISIWSRSYGELGPIAGPILAAIETAGLIATAAVQIKNINAQRLDAPNESMSDGGSSSAAPSFAALMPSQTTMTTSQENLNMMNASNKVETVVKVSDINEVQRIVKVRESNSSY